MLVLAEVTLNNRSFTQEPLVTTVEEVELQDLGESYVAIRGEIFLRKILPISQASIQFKIECLERNIFLAQKDLEFVTMQEASIKDDIDQGHCKPEWAASYLEDYSSRSQEHKAQLQASKEMLEMYTKYIIVKD